MKPILRFSWSYFLLTVAIFLIEVLIAALLHDRIIRPYIGDLLVVILIYCFVRSFMNTPVVKTAAAVLLFAFLIEALQCFRIVHKLGLQDSRVARIVIGTAFEWTDLLAYTFGIAIVLWIEYAISKKRTAGSAS